MKFTLKAVAIVGLAVATCAAWSQGGGGGGGQRRAMRGPQGPVQLVQREDVQTDLALTADEKTKVADLAKAMNDERTSIAENAQAAGSPDPQQTQADMRKLNDKYAAQLATILTADQNKRLNEIRIQMTGMRIVADPQVAKDLGLSDDQNTKVKAAIDKNQTASRDLMQKVRNGELDRSAVGDERKKLDDGLNAEIGAILTDVQKSKLKDMQGKVFVRKDSGGGGG